VYDDVGLRVGEGAAACREALREAFGDESAYLGAHSADR